MSILNDLKLSCPDTYDAFLVWAAARGRTEGDMTSREEFIAISACLLPYLDTTTAPVARLITEADYLPGTKYGEYATLITTSFTTLEGA